jgi:hypothetical protein
MKGFMTGMIGGVHNFKQSLARSHAQADAPWWLDVYRRAFPSLASSVCVRNDSWAQRGGIDRVRTLKGGRTITIDEPGVPPRVPTPYAPQGITPTRLPHDRVSSLAETLLPHLVSRHISH